MRIGIDARLGGASHAGIGRYVEELLRQLLSMRTPHQWVIFVSQEHQFEWLKPSQRIKIVVAPIRHYTIVEQLVMPAVFLKENLDLLHVPHFNIPLLYPKKYVVTIHDLLWHERKDARATTLSPFLHAIKYGAYRYTAETAIRRAAAVCVPTEHVKQSVARFTDASKIFVTKEGVAQVYTSYKEKASSTTKEKFAFPYVVYVGSLYPHKNVSCVLRALEQMKTLHAVIISGRSVFYDAFEAEVTSRGLSERVHLMGYLPDEHVVELEASSLALIPPSFSEGFGLSGLESMGVGTPVVASDIPVFHEVYQDGALFFDPYRPEDLVKKLLELQNKKGLRQQLIKNGKQVVAQYSWKTMAEQTLHMYETV